MAWDVDGTVGMSRQVPLGAMVAITSGQAANLNGEQHGDHLTYWSNNRSYQVYWLFPEAREIDGVFACGNKSDNGGPRPGLVESSSTSTNGLDGIWTLLIANMPDFYSTIPEYREEIISAAVATETGLRMEWITLTNVSLSPASLHIYGTISPGETPDRIIFLDTENADQEFTKVLDFAEVPRGQTTTRTFKIKNNSSSKTINTVQVTAEDLYLNAGDWYEFGDDGVNYQATFTVGNMTNGSEETIHLKQIVPPAETLGLQAARIKVSHDSVT